MEATSMSQVALSKELGLSPQNLSLILRGTNCPNSETTLQIIETIEPKTMKTLIDPPRTQPTARSDNRPRTLALAIEALEDANSTIDELRSEVVRLKAAAVAKPALTVPAPTAKPINTPGADQPNKTPMAVTVPATPKKALPPEANTPVLAQLILDKTVFDDLLSMLDNPVHSSMQRAVIYAEIKKRRSIEGNRFQ
jgi:hypothetical protein